MTDPTLAFAQATPEDHWYAAAAGAAVGVVAIEEIMDAIGGGYVSVLVQCRAIQGSGSMTMAVKSSGDAGQQTDISTSWSESTAWAAYGDSLVFNDPSGNVLGVELMVVGLNARESEKVLKDRMSTKPATVLLDTDTDARTVAVGGTLDTFSADITYVRFTQGVAIAVSLPAENDHKKAYLANEGTGNVTLSGQGGDTINGAGTFAIAPGDAIQVIREGTDWIAVG